jgi:hypothetical protein
MREIAIHELRDGQILAGDVFDERGGLLLSAGMALSPEHVELLERRGVLTVKIAEADEGEGPADQAPGGGGPGGGAPGEDEFAKALARLDHMFEGLHDDPVMRAIYAAARGMLESALGK